MDKIFCSPHSQRAGGAFRSYIPRPRKALGGPGDSYKNNNFEKQADDFLVISCDYNTRTSPERRNTP